MKLELQIKTAYGVSRLYPLNTLAKLFCKLLQTKTLTPEHVRLIQEMGIQADVVAPSVDGLINRIEKGNAK